MVIGVKMETQLKDLLEDFDKALPKGITHQELLEKGHSVELINSALTSLLIHTLNSSYYLNNEGISMIIQLRTKQAIDNLDNSIKKFDESSSKLSKMLLYLTIAIAIMTAILVIKEFL